MELFLATSRERLNEVSVITNEQSAVTVVAVSGGYPNEYEVGKEMTGLIKNHFLNTLVFHSGTKNDGEKIVTNGGRVLAVTSFGKTVKEAVEKSNQTLKNIHFERMFSEMILVMNLNNATLNL
ncbi:MAG: phosphoribosylglycinamide synthetase C domain-containing protein [Ferruginibacter sp.]